MDRRRFLTAAGATAATLGLGPTRAATRADRVVTQRGDRLWLVSGAGANVTVFAPPEGVLLVDGGSRELSAALLRKVRELTGERRVHTLFNTHWHWDNTGSNESLRKAGTRIISHENTRLWLTVDVDSKWEGRTYPRRPAALPTETFHTTGVLEFGGERIEYGVMPQAHTDGDIYVHFREADILVGGDVLASGSYPVIDYCTNGWVGGMANAVRAVLERTGEATRYVPGSGPVLARADVTAEGEMLTTMRQRLAKLLAQGMSIDDMIAAQPTRDFDDRWGDPRLFIANSWYGLVHRSRELGVSIV
jgi:cyclase